MPNPVQLSYALTPADVRAYSIWAATNDTEHTRQRRDEAKWQLIFTFALATGAYFLCETPYQAWTVSILILIAGASVTWEQYQNYATRAATHVLDRESRAPSPGTYEEASTIIDDTGISSKSKYRHSHITWEAITRHDLTPEHLIVRSGSRPICIIPRRILDAENFETITSWCRERIRNVG
jgi:hypothetical protein